MSLLFNMLSRSVMTFLQRSQCLLISWLQSPSAVILEPKNIKSVTVSTVSPSICHEVMGPDAMILVFWMLSFKSTFSLSSSTFIKRLFSSLLSAIRVMSSAYLRLLIFLLKILIPGSERSPGRKDGNPFQYSCPENLMAEETGRIHGVTKSQTWLKWLSTHAQCLSTCEKFKTTYK